MQISAVVNHGPQRQRIRIAFVMTGLTLGGAEMMLWKLLSRIDRSRFEPLVITLDTTTAMRQHFANIGIPCSVLAMKFGYDALVKVWRLGRILRDFAPDIVQGWMYHGNIAATLGAAIARTRAPVLWSIHNGLNDLSREKLSLAFTIRLGGKLSFSPVKIVNVAVSSAIEHERRLGYIAAKRHIVPIGFDTQLFRPSPEARIEIRHSLGIANDTVLIGLIGRYDPMKDHDNFLHAAALLDDVRPQPHFLLAGVDIDASNARLNAAIEQYGLGGRVHLLGRRDDMARVTAALDVSVSSSRAEAFPNVIGEAMSCGVPCAVTDVGDSAMIVGTTGKIVPARDPESLAAALREFIVLGPANRKEFGTRARQRIVDNFSLDRIVSRYEELYSELLTASAA